MTEADHSHRSKRDREIPRIIDWALLDELAESNGAMLHGIIHGAFPSSPLTMQRLALELGCGANVQRLNNPRIDCRNDVHSAV